MDGIRCQTDHEPSDFDGHVLSLQEQEKQICIARIVDMSHMIWPCTVTSRTRETDPYRQNCKHIIFSFNLIDLISLSLRRDSVHKCDYVVGPAGRARRCEALLQSGGSVWILERLPGLLARDRFHLDELNCDLFFCFVLHY